MSRMNGKKSHKKYSRQFFVLFAPHFRPTGLNVLRYQSHLLQRCHPACGHEEYSPLSPVLALWFVITMQVQRSYNSSTNEWLNLTYSRSHAFHYGRKKTNSGFPKNRTHDFRTKLLVGVRGYLLDHSGNAGSRRNCSSYPKTSWRPYVSNVLGYSCTWKGFCRDLDPS